MKVGNAPLPGGTTAAGVGQPASSGFKLKGKAMQTKATVAEAAAYDANLDLLDDKEEMKRMVI